jgi:hypothetical protein
MALHVVYGKLNKKFEQLWYHKSRLKIHLKLTGSKWCSTQLHIKNLIYYDHNNHNKHNLIINNYFLGFHEVEI